MTDKITTKVEANVWGDAQWSPQVLATKVGAFVWMDYFSSSLFIASKVSAFVWADNTPGGGGGPVASRNPNQLVIMTS